VNPGIGLDRARLTEGMVSISRIEGMASTPSRASPPILWLKTTSA
jgi:hypothetical protein